MAATMSSGRAGRERRPAGAARRWWRRLLQAVVVATCLGLAPSGWIKAYAAGSTRTVADAPAEPVVLVFGAGVTGLVPSPFLARRLDVAIGLYRAGKATVIVCTGDDSGHGYDEPAAMRRYLLAHGIPAARIVTDGAGMDTWASCWRARHVYGVTRALLVSQDFHVPRAVALCRAAGIRAYGVPDTGEYAAGARQAAADALREIPAGFKATLQVLGAGHTPRDAGTSPAVREALRAAR
jgi:vancomycin permeability regulator SanA